MHAERHALKRAQVPIITVSATYKKELIAKYRTLTPPTSEAIFSRAHYSMAEAVRQQAILSKKSSHMVDPTNFVSREDWSKIDFTETVGHLMARHQTLKWLKDQIDTYVRNKLPITEAITPPLIYLAEDIKKPIISLHYESGNIVSNLGISIIQVLTDPHVRPQYLDPLPPIDQKQNSSTSNPNTPLITFTTFDNQTKKDLITMAQKLGKQIDSKNVIVTGPPVDPRITKLAKRRSKIAKDRPINIGITTGGLGTNLSEIKHVLDQLKPLIKPGSEQIKLFLYAGNHRDFRNFFETYSAHNNLRIGNLDDTKATIRILYEDSIIDANENLIKYMFPWADAVITKPSGDMAYDLAAAGIVGLYLQPWGEWEENIQKSLTKKGVAFDLKVKKAHNHLSYLIRTNALKKAQTKTINLPPLFRNGCKNIVRLHTQLSKNK